MTVQDHALTQTTDAISPPDISKRYLFGPLVDFLSLGGLTLFLLPFLAVAPPAPVISGSVIFLVSTYILNSPHFLSTYQIYYRGFRRKAFSPDLSRKFRLRYLFAGVIFPLSLLAFIAFAVTRPDTVMIGYLGNLLTFLVVWHYTKQGYGVLIIDSVYKKRFLGNFEKKVFRYNALACWLFFWVLANAIIPQGSYGKIIYYSFHLPPEILGCTALLAIATGVAVLFVIARRIVRKQKLPITGVITYLITVYIWQFGFFYPVMMLIVPALHAIQYDAVVLRYEINRESANRESRFPLWARLAGFCGLAVLLGIWGFYVGPTQLDGMVKYDRAIFGTFLFAFIFHMFINVHHFVMDGVIWHHTNPETAAFLFNRGAPQAPVQQKLAG